MDIIGHKVFAFDPKNGSNLAFDVGESVGAVVLSENDKLLLALRGGFAWLDPESGRLTHLLDPESDNPATRFNDGKCDPRGRFGCGSPFGAAARSCVTIRDVRASWQRSRSPRRTSRRARLVGHS